jgi:hypothetical protein
MHDSFLQMAGKQIVHIAVCLFLACLGIYLNKNMFLVYNTVMCVFSLIPL